MTRLIVCVRQALVAALVLVVGCAVVEAQPARTVQDLRGRSVTLKRPATRLLIDDGRYMLALALMHQNPGSIVAAWPHDTNRLGASAYKQLLSRQPSLGTLPRVASSAGTFSLEGALAARPDVALFTLGHGPTDAQVKQLESAGIVVVFIDFFTQPAANLERSLLVLGTVVGRETQAQAFVAYRREHVARIRDRVAASKAPRPKVFVEAHAGMSAECCNSLGKGNVGDYVTLVGGHNIGGDVIPGAFGRLNVEYVLAQNPAVYIATGGPHLEKTGGLVVGPGYSTERARASLGAMTQRPVLSQLGAVKAGRVYGLSHQLLNSPLDLVAVEALAVWIRPDLFKDLDPSATLAEINRRFLAFPIEGEQWVALR
ncbi:MAG: ABC transporter substrate-binding protein [Acidobacteria bacterium]|nr:ABC transporter substrate-binding protein [Acidobacteriota bacterium]